MGSRTNGVVPVECAGSSNGGGSGGAAVEKGVDFANYFCTYAFLYHQKEMLSDRARMDAYFNSIFQKKHHFQEKELEVAFLQFGRRKRVPGRSVLWKLLRCQSILAQLLSQ